MAPAAACLISYIIMKSKLNSFENYLYFCVWTSACLYSIYKFREAQTDLFYENPHLSFYLSDLKPGWSFLSRLKDESDIEWSTLLFLLKTSWLYLFLQFVLSEIIRWKSNILVLKYWYILSSTIFVGLYMGYKHMLLIYAQPVLYMIILYLGGRKISIWVTSVLLLLSYNSLKHKSYFWQFVESDNSKDEQVILLLFGMAWVELRCISYSIDYIDKIAELKMTKDKVNNQTSHFGDLVNMFSYVLYLPVLYVGPLILYEEFERSFNVKNEKLLLKLRRFTIDTILYGIYAILLEFSLHYMYFYAMHSNMEAIKRLPTLALIGGGLWMGFEFHTKYVISYGTMAAFARLDNIDAPPTPRCIARIHLYSQMWRYFDVGLYRFLVKYIYKPLQETVTTYISMSMVIYKMISSFTTFVFIFAWHGTMWSIFMWSALNYVGILTEVVGRSIGNTEKYRRFKQNVLKTDAMEARFIAFFGAPLLGYSIISSFYLFGGSEIGNLYFGLLKWPAWYNLLFVYFTLYCSCHVGMALQDVPSRTDVSKIVEKTVKLK